MDRSNLLHGASYFPSNPKLPGEKSDSRISQATIVKAVVASFIVLGGIFLVHHNAALHQLKTTSHLTPELIASACTGTRFPEVCISSLSSTKENFHPEALMIEISKQAFHRALLGISSVHSIISSLKESSAEQKAEERAVFRDCIELMDRAQEQVHLSLDNLHHLREEFTTSKVDDIRTSLSAALTFHTTCTDEFSNIDNNFVKAEGSYVEKLISNALAFATRLYISRNAFFGRRERINSEDGMFRLRYRRTKLAENIFPEWMEARDEEFLRAISPTPNVIVALDGSGNYKSVQAAVDAAPQQSSSRYVIYIKAGTYNEQVIIPKSATNLMFIGDGMGKTIITGSKNVQQTGVTTFTSATVAVNANGFLARDLTFQNTAGAINHQAVALRVSADQAAFYRCSMEGYQDTLYSHSLRQFYRECTIYGTVDYIFGNAAAVFQSCILLARVPLKGQQNTYTAQGRTDPNQNTGLSFQSCTVDGTSDLKSSISNYPTYLGRPWQQYSRTVFLQSYESSVVNPAGWLPWSGDFALKTLFYGEYECSGPGAGAAKRVTWSTQITSVSVANQYTVTSLIGGTNWLPSTSFPYQAGL